MGVHMGYFNDLVINPNYPAHLFVSGSSNNSMALYRSFDGGESWAAQQVPAYKGYGNAIAIDFGNDNVIYIGGQIGLNPALFKSVDGGKSWISVTGSISGIVTALAVDPVVPTRVYAGTTTGIFQSEDGGLSWTRRAPYAAKCLKINSLSSNEVYAGGTSGLFVSNDYGVTWTSMNEGLMISQISCIDLNPQEEILYAGSLGGGIYKKNKRDVCTLIIRAGAGGTTMPPPGTYSYIQGQNVDLEAVPDKFYNFGSWAGSVASTDRRLRIVMNSDTAVKANFSRIIFAPLHLTGQKKINRSLLFGRYVNVLTWQANPDNTEIASYRIYLMSGDAMSLLAEVNANTFEFWHRDVRKDQFCRYAVCAVDAQGRQGEFSYVEIK